MGERSDCDHDHDHEQQEVQVQMGVCEQQRHVVLDLYEPRHVDSSGSQGPKMVATDSEDGLSLE